MPAPTKMYKLIGGKPDYYADVTEVNVLAGQGWEVEQMLQVGGGAAPGRFLYLMSRTVTAEQWKEEEEKPDG
jgi:hypothetical protein